MDGFHKTRIIVRDFSLNPSCEHGPTILFQRNHEKFFACSAYRDRKLCSFYLPEEKWISTKEKPLKTDFSKTFKKASVASTSASGVTAVIPPPSQVNKGKAQFHFAPETTEFLSSLLKDVGISEVICLGTPSLHQFLKEEGTVPSFLLDIDDRLISQFPVEESALYNMCNHHFFQEEGKRSYQQFLKTSGSLCVVMDPPFGAKAEILWNGGLSSIKRDFMAAVGEKRFEIIWIFPYFMEGHILKGCEGSGLQMSDYKVMYSNHSKFKEKSESGSDGQGKSSPVRMFTTIPLSTIKLPEDSSRFCKICDKWVDVRNKHCGVCETCTTKDGGDSYWHCKECKKCVKPTWLHCVSPCGFCHLKDSNCRTRRNIKSSYSDPLCIQDKSVKNNKRKKNESHKVMKRSRIQSKQIRNDDRLKSNRRTKNK